MRPDLGICSPASAYWAAEQCSRALHQRQKARFSGAFVPAGVCSHVRRDNGSNCLPRDRDVLLPPKKGLRLPLCVFVFDFQGQRI